MWNKIPDSYYPGYIGMWHIGMFFASFATVPVDVILTVTGVHPYHFYSLRKSTKAVLAGSYRKTRIEPYHIPHRFDSRFSQELLRGLGLEFIEDQLRRELDEREASKEAHIMVDHKIKKDRAFVHLKYTRKTVSGQRHGFQEAHFFLALRLSSEDRVIHIEEVKAIKENGPAMIDHRAAEFEAFTTGSFHNPFDLLADPMELVRQRYPGLHQDFGREVPAQEGAINPRSVSE
jgi:hypothetical protein